MEKETKKRNQLIPPKNIFKKIPNYDSLLDVESFDDCTVYVKYFLAGFLWYVIAADEYPDGDILFYGYVKNPITPTYSEWGDFTLSQLQSFRALGFMKVERDKFFKPVKFLKLRQEENLY